ncbi:hypothetical protein [Prosthecobacter sp.]|uniref:hypothetical protein n=1 Tax=Prosthecobacter sp. TaxID=1965333 RepID=UPI003783C44C
MQATAPSPTSREAGAVHTPPAFSVVALHDGFFAHVRAMEALEWLKESLSPDLRVCPITWSFDKLERHEESSTAARAAAAADLLIVSATNDRPMPEHIRKWCNEIPKQQRDTRPIVVALHEENCELNGERGWFCSQLKEVADAWRTDFICNADFDRRLDCDFAMQIVSSKNPSSYRRAKPFGGEFAPPPRYWGIND